jgi:predicted nucleic acid-binding Zn ribbon protein
MAETPKIRWLKRPRPQTYVWVCDRCPQHITVSVELSDPPEHRCSYTDEKGKYHIKYTKLRLK